MQLIEINNTVAVGDSLIQTVNARELHGFLGNKSRFNDWIRKRIVDFGFVEGVDFAKFELEAGIKLSESGSELGGLDSTQKNVALESSTYADFGQQGRVEFAVTIGMAKELAMVERNDQGKKARLYFIECEKRLYEVAPASSLPSYPDALRQLADTVERNAQQAIQIAQQTSLIETQKPSVEFVDKYVDASGLKTFREVAKLINANEREFRNFLADRGFNVRLNGTWTHAARYGDKGTKLYTRRTSVNSAGVSFERSYYTPKGVVSIAKLWDTRVPMLRKPLKTTEIN